MHLSLSQPLAETQEQASSVRQTSAKTDVQLITVGGHSLTADKSWGNSSSVLKVFKDKRFEESVATVAQLTACQASSPRDQPRAKEFVTRRYVMCQESLIIYVGKSRIYFSFRPLSVSTRLHQFHRTEHTAHHYFINILSSSFNGSGFKPYTDRA